MNLMFNLELCPMLFDDTGNRQWVTQSSHAQDNTYTIQNKKTLGEYRCGTDQKPSEG